MATLTSDWFARRSFWATVRYVFLVGLAIVTLVPFAFMLSTAFTPRSDVWHIPHYWLPPNFTFDNFTYVLFGAQFPMFRWLLNSVVVSTATTVVVVTVDALAAYGFARLKMPGRDFLFGLILLSLMVPIAVTLIPIFLLMRDLHFFNTYNALVWPAAANAFGVFLLRQFFMTIPVELEEAARLDGAGKLRIFWSIDLPLVRNALVTLALLTWLVSWNDYFWPVIALTDENSFTSPVAIVYVRGISGGLPDLGPLMAVATLIVLPPFLFYLIFQRRIREAVATTGLAGR